MRSQREKAARLLRAEQALGSALRLFGQNRAHHGEHVQAAGIELGQNVEEGTPTESGAVSDRQEALAAAS
jgi:hypothetical protein